MVGEGLVVRPVEQRRGQHPPHAPRLVQLVPPTRPGSIMLSVFGGLGAGAGPSCWLLVTASWAVDLR